MTVDHVRELAENGMSTAPGEQLPEVIKVCRERCRVDGDAALCILGEALSEFLEWWAEMSESGGAPLNLIETIEEVLRRDLREVLDEPDQSFAAQKAEALASEIRANIRSQSKW